MKPGGEWPQSTKPYRVSPPEGTVGIVIPLHDNLKFFKLAFHSILDFTDYRYMLTIVDNMSSFSTRQYLESIRRNHNVNVLQYQKDHSQAAEWNLGLQFMFAFASVQYAVVMTPSIVVEPNWLSGLMKTLSRDDVSIVEPRSNTCLNHEHTIHLEEVDALKPFCLGFKRPAWEKLGGFNEALSESGPVVQDFGNRARKEGFRLFCDPSVYVHHFYRNGYRANPDSMARDMVYLNSQKDGVTL